jgi:hypothetical protein
MKCLFALAGFTILVGGVFFSYYQGTQTEGLSWWGEQFPVISFLLTVVCMFSGIFFGCLYRRIRNQQGSVQILKEVKGVFSSSSFIGAMCVAPFLFISVYNLVGHQPGEVSSYLLAFQNGFFWESVFREFQPHASSPT